MFSFLDFSVDELHLEMATREFSELEIISEIAKTKDVAVGIIDVKVCIADSRERCRACPPLPRARSADRGSGGRVTFARSVFSETSVEERLRFGSSGKAFFNRTVEPIVGKCGSQPSLLGNYEDRAACLMR